MGSLNLQTKIILYTVGVIAAMVVAFTTMNFWMDVTSTREHLRQYLVDLTENIAPAIRDDLANDRIDTLKESARHFSYNDMVVSIAFLDPRMAAITSVGQSGNLELPDPPGDVPEGEISVWSVGERLAALAPVTGQQGELLGYVQVLATSEEAFMLLRRKLSRSLVFAALFGVGGCLIGFCAGKRLTRPLEELIQAAEDLATGREPDTVDVESGDELGKLSKSFNRMVERRRDAERSLERSRQHLLFILQETPLGYIEWDLNFRVAGWNKAAERIFGYKEEEALGRRGLELIVDPELQDEIEEIWEAILSEKGGNEKLNQNVRKDGSHVICQWNNTVIRDSAGKPMAVASLVNDVTESMKTQETMRIAMEEAQKATRAKSEFLANMSHEIRTPMNGVIGLTELLLESDLNSEQRSYLDVIRSSGEMLITIINDILDLSKVESGKLKLSERVFDVDKCLRSAFVLFKHDLDRKGLESRIDLDTSLPKTANGDPIRLRQVIYNLVSNAVKFTDTGSVHLKAWAEEITSMRMRLHVSVEDSGPGIDPGLMDAIFEPFSQADTSSTRSYGGTGLGLTICKRICNLMRGDIRVDKSNPEGTRFSFHVELQSAPRESLTASTGNPGNALQAHVPRSNLKILVVEDNAVNRLVTKRILNRLGYDCEVVENGKDAVAYVSSNGCDLIFMDLQMPVMDGLTATRILREQDKDRPAIVALTASAVEGDRERCLGAGMQDYISKPVNIDSVRQVIERLVSSRGAQA